MTSAAPTAAAEPAIFDRMGTLADPTRGRLLLLLERHVLSVGELCSVLQQPQSTVSRHLKVLGDGGWITSWRDGTSRNYTMAGDRLDAAGRELWRVVRGGVDGMPAAGQDRARLASVLADRRGRSREFFSSAAGEWDRLRAELFGARAELAPLLGLLDPRWTIGDLGCGTGSSAAALAPFVARVIAVDESPAMLEAARRRLAGSANVELRPGSLEALPVGDGELDAAILGLVLHHVADPPAALAEAARALAPGGRLLVIDMMPHDRERYRQEMGHLWLGFPGEQLAAWLTEAGFAAPHLTELPPDPAARGPNLFAAGAVRRTEEARP